MTHPHGWERRAVLALAAGWLGAVASGCAGRQEKRGIARVTVRAASPQIIGLAAEQVFRREGFRGAADPAQMIFTREGGGGAALAYGTWISGVSTEVEVYILRISDGLYELWCEAYQVRSADDAIFADRQRLTRVHASTYRRCLEDVRDLVQPGAR